MNNNKTTTAAPTDNTQLIQKLRSEYISLKERVNSMNAFLINIDFERRVPDPEEQCLMQEKYNSMLNYLMNLRHCIMYYERQQLEKIVNDQTGIDSISKDGMGYLLATLKDGRTLDLRKIDISKNAAAIILDDKDPSLLEDVDVKAACDELEKAWNAYKERQHDNTHHCRPGRLVNHDEQPIEIKTQREPTFDSNPKCYFCGGVIEGLPWIKEGKPACKKCSDNTHHCGQDASCQVGDGSAVVDKPVISGDSLKDLLGMEVISVGDMPCDACKPDNYAGRPCVKVELVGGTYLCLAPLPNSIVTE